MGWEIPFFFAEGGNIVVLFNTAYVLLKCCLITSNKSFSKYFHSAASSVQKILHFLLLFFLSLSLVSFFLLKLVKVILHN